MQAELDDLVAKLERLVAHCAHLQSDNRALREAATRAVAERDAATDKLAAARARLQDLIARLPDTP
jgi:uncharacterized protein (TIGR02449 family)